jgi:hypothetical protein
MKHLTILLALITSAANAQTFEQQLQSFNKVIVSPGVNLILIPGESEQIKIDYHGVDESEVIIEQKAKKLHVYLKDAKIVDITDRYRHASITAYVTFKHIRVIEARGEGNVLCDGKIAAKRLKIRAYGETDIRLAHVDAATVRARLYGANKITILEGDAGHLNYKMYGENTIDSRGLVSVTSSTTMYGEGRINLHTTEEVRVNSFGEPSLYVSGSPVISRGIIIGHTNIRRN